MRKRKAFTLIELLVVVAIIGILATVVVSSISGAQKKARLASGLSFSKNIDRLFALNLQNSWNFDDILTDATSNKQDGLWNGAAIAYQNDTPTSLGKSLFFNGTDNYVSFVNNYWTSVFNNQPENNFTISAWIKPDDHNVDESIACQRQNDSVCFGLSTNNKLFFRWDDSNVASSNRPVLLGEWSHVAVSFWNAEPPLQKKAVFYINGSQVGEAAINDPGIDIQGLFHIGWQSRTGLATTYYKGLIDEVRIYNKLISAEVGLE